MVHAQTHTGCAIAVRQSLSRRSGTAYIHGTRHHLIRTARRQPGSSSPQQCPPAPPAATTHTAREESCTFYSPLDMARLFKFRPHARQAPNRRYPGTSQFRGQRCSPDCSPFPRISSPHVTRADTRRGGRGRKRRPRRIPASMQRGKQRTYFSCIVWLYKLNPDTRHPSVQVGGLRRREAGGRFPTARQRP